MHKELKMNFKQLTLLKYIKVNKIKIVNKLGKKLNKKTVWVALTSKWHESHHQNINTFVI